MTPFIVYLIMKFPKKIKLKINSCLADILEDRQAVREYIADYLFDLYSEEMDGLTLQFDYKVKGDEIIVSNIEEW